jgi:hypothetical protein
MTLFVPNIVQMQPSIVLTVSIMPIALTKNAANMRIMRIIAPNSIAKNMLVQWMPAVENKSTIANNIVRNSQIARIQLA